MDKIVTVHQKSGTRVVFRVVDNNTETFPASFTLLEDDFCFDFGRLDERTSAA